MTEHRDDAETPVRRSVGAAGRRLFGRYPLRASIGLGIVGLLAGLLFSTSASLASTSPERRPENLRDLVRLETDRLADTNTEVVALREELATLLASQTDPEAADPDTQLAAGSSAVSGPGVVVRLWDAPVPAEMPDGVTGDDLVVHQQDIEAVMNALWAGGAEAMTVQGHRVTATSSVRCVGNVLLIDGSTYSPPYEIAAIGDPDELRATLMGMPSIRVYLQYVEAFGLGWSVADDGALAMPADDTNLELEYADVPG